MSKRIISRFSEVNQAEIEAWSCMEVCQILSLEYSASLILLAHSLVIESILFTIYLWISFVRNLRDFIKRLPLDQQLALTAGFCCLLATLVLGVIAARSNQYIHSNLQDEYGRSVAEQLAGRISTELAAGDRLSVVSELARLVEQPSVVSARVLGIEDTELALAGEWVTGDRSFKAPIYIAGDAAGTVEVVISTDLQDVTQLQFLLVMSVFAILISVVIYLITRVMVQRLAGSLRTFSVELASVVGSTDNTSANEVQALRERIAALPLDLLRLREVSESGVNHYVESAILFIHFRSLLSYFDTIDERRLQRYIAMIHRMVFGAAGFYDGELEVVRQFGAVIWFHGKHNVGSPVLRAASCAWLIDQTAFELEKELRLSVRLGMAVGANDIGRGDAEDIYPGLRAQAVIDDLQQLAMQQVGGVALSPFVINDVDLTACTQIETVDGKFHQLGPIADSQRGLLRCQLQILLRALIKAKITI